MTDPARRVPLAALARVEGEGALHVRFEGDRLAELALHLFEPPRLFEAFLPGRRAEELPDLVARICGICPVAYQMTVVHALEAAFGVAIDPGVRALRRLYVAGEWIESHLLHILFLASPDYLGVDDVFAVARRCRREVERGMRLRRLGNRILTLLGARPVNPVGVVIGGFARLPGAAERRALAEELRAGRGEMEALLRWLETLPVPRRPRDPELVALAPARGYPMNEGRIRSSRGLDLTADAWDEAFEEHQVPRSTALHARVRGRGAYLVGPLARVILHADRLGPTAGAAFERLAHRFAPADPAASVFARALEVLQAFDEALAALALLEAPGALEAAAAPAWAPRAGAAAWATEAPRGLLWMALRTEASGHLAEIRIVPPTSQNQAWIEEDLRALAASLGPAPDETLRRRCEAAVRDYDPCISCSAHFLTLHAERGPAPCASS